MGDKENLLGKRLKQAVEESGKKLVDIAKETNIPKASLSQYISGYAKPKQDRIYLICQSLQINEAWLMGYDVPMRKTDERKSLEHEALELFDELNPDQKELILNMMKNMKRG